jgi:uncharacterized protein (DUF924 family)
MDIASDDVLRFWFDDLKSDSDFPEQRFSLWFTKNPKTDETIRSQFSLAINQATIGELDSWSDKPRSCLALIILLDQFRRNIFRDTSDAFSSDSKALELSRSAVGQMFDKQLRPIERVFMYLPFEHSEALADQHRSVELYKKLKADSPPEIRERMQSFVDYAEKHRKVILEYGRFPHRNLILDRQSTPAEIEYLKKPGSGF